MRISEAKEYIKNVQHVDEKFLRRLIHSDKKGLRDLAAKYVERNKREELERERLERLKIFERKAIAKGHMVVAGIDEAGRGPLAGPVVASAVIISVKSVILSMNDSKKLTAKTREVLFDKVFEQAVGIGIGLATAEEIDKYNILEATKLACYRAINQLDPKPDLLLTDALKLDKAGIEFWNIIKGDAKSFSIASASVIAKVTRDRLMAEYHDEYPIYEFKRNKGYGCAKHLSVLRRRGPSTLHRLSFRRVGRSSDGGIRSKSFVAFTDEIYCATSKRLLSSVSGKIRTLADFLPECEIRELRGAFKKRMNVLKGK